MAKANTYFKYPTTISIDDALGSEEPRTNQLQEVEDKIFKDSIIEKYTGVKRQVLVLLFEGENFNQIAQRLSLKQSQAYKIKKQLSKELVYLLNDRTAQNYTDADTLKNLLYLFILATGICSPIEIYKQWDNTKPLMDYSKPSMMNLKRWCNDIVVILIERGIKK